MLNIPRVKRSQKKNFPVDQGVNTSSPKMESQHTVIHSLHNIEPNSIIHRCIPSCSHSFHLSVPSSDSSFYFPLFVFFRFLVLLACCSDPHLCAPSSHPHLNFLYELFDLGVAKQSMTDKPPVTYVLVMITKVCYQSGLSRNSEMVCHVIWTALLLALLTFCPLRTITQFT